jgi:AraC-like DNA-binding protein
MLVAVRAVPPALPPWDASAIVRQDALLDRFLLGRLADGPRPSPEVGWAWARLVATGGAVPIGRLAGEVGWSHKQLIARFRQQIGLRPKTAARLVRFDGVWRRLDGERGRLDWVDLAREVGNADQAHLVREFHQFTGTTPTAFAARTLPPMGITGSRSIPFKTRSPPLPSLAHGRFAIGGRGRTLPRTRRPRPLPAACRRRNACHEVAARLGAGSSR